MKQLFQPKVILLVTSLVVIIFCLINHHATVDFHLHDTFLVVDNKFIAFFIGGSILLQSLLYQLTDNYKQWRSMQYLHVFSIVFIMLGSLILHNYPPDGAHDFNSFYQISYVMAAFVLFFALGQILFIVNLIAGFVRGKKVLNHDR